MKPLSGSFCGRNLGRERSLSFATFWVALTPSRSFPKHFPPLWDIEGATGYLRVPLKTSLNLRTLQSLLNTSQTLLDILRADSQYT